MVSDYIKTELRSAWSGVYLDGRNEHGTHVLPLSERSVEVEADAMLKEYAEEITAAAEAAGHVINDAVVVTWRWVCADGDEPAHYELLAPYHADLTALFYGTPHEQRTKRRWEEQRAEESAARWM